MRRDRGQLSLPIPSSWGGRRAGAGRKSTPGRRPGVAHRARPVHAARHPVHVTLRAAETVHGLRAGRVFRAVRAALGAASGPRFRIVQFSAQHDHLHLIVEADGRTALSRGIQGAAIRVARAVNRALGRRGRVWADRFHARALTTPREVRNALVYVLTNGRKHGMTRDGIDPCSSGPWFDGWREAIPASGSAPVAPARTWLARVGWRIHGLIGSHERPALPRRRPGVTRDNVRRRQRPCEAARQDAVGVPAEAGGVAELLVAPPPERRLRPGGPR